MRALPPLPGHFTAGALTTTTPLPLVAAVEWVCQRGFQYGGRLEVDDALTDVAQGASRALRSAWPPTGTVANPLNTKALDRGDLALLVLHLTRFYSPLAARNRGQLLGAVAERRAQLRKQLEELTGCLSLPPRDDQTLLDWYASTKHEDCDSPPDPPSTAGYSLLFESRLGKCCCSGRSSLTSSPTRPCWTTWPP
jgi:hypothetical protein